MSQTTFFPTVHTWNPSVVSEDYLDPEHTTFPSLFPDLSTARVQHIEPFSQVHEKISTLSAALDPEPTTLPPVPDLSTGKVHLIEPFSQVQENFTTLLEGDHHKLGIHERDDELIPIILIAVIAATLLVFLCVFLALRYALKHKGSYHTQEDKEGNWGDADDTALKNGHSFQDLDEDV